MWLFLYMGFTVHWGYNTTFKKKYYKSKKKKKTTTHCTCEEVIHINSSSQWALVENKKAHLSFFKYWHLCVGEDRKVVAPTISSQKWLWSNVTVTQMANLLLKVVLLLKNQWIIKSTLLFVQISRSHLTFPK